MATKKQNKVKPGQIWLQRSSNRRFKILSVSENTCALFNLETNMNANETYELIHFKVGQWELINDPKAEPLTTYQTVFCAVGCGTVKVYEPGEIVVGSFTCDTCKRLAKIESAGPRRRTFRVNFDT